MTGPIFARMKNLKEQKNENFWKLLGNNPNLQVQMHNGD